MIRWHKHCTGLDQVRIMLRLEQQHQGSWQAGLVAGAAALFNAWMGSDHRGSNSQTIDFESVKIYPIFTVKIEKPGKSNT